MGENKTKTKKKIKRRLKIKGVLFLVSIFALLYFVIEIFLNIPIKAINIFGNELVKTSEILKLSNLTNETKYLGFISSNTCNRIKDNALIKNCQIKRTLDLKVEIIIEENTPLFYYTTDSSIILENKSKITTQNSLGLPTLINFVPEDILEKFISGLSNINIDIIHSISEIEYQPSANEDGTFIDKERFVFLMNDGNTVIINNKRMNIFNHYDKIYASIGDKKGTYNFDSDYGNYIFTEYGE